MSSKLSIFGADLVGAYQLCFMKHTYNLGSIFPSIGTWYTPFGMYLLNNATGQLIEASDCPVEMKPSVFVQGTKNPFGDSEVTHAKVSGTLIPEPVITALGSAFPIVPLTRGTGFYVYNYSSTKTKRYNRNASTYVLENLRTQYYSESEFYCDIGGYPLHGIKLVKKTADGLHLNMTVTRGNTTAIYEIHIKGRPLYLKNVGTSGKMPDFTNGSYVLRYTTNGGSTWTTLDNSVSTGLSLVYYSPPVSLDGLSSAFIFSGMDPMGFSGIIRDLSSLLLLPKGNSPYLSCYNAVESMKAVKVASLEYMRDITQIQKLKPPFKAFASLASPKSWAEVYLWFIYGIRPTFKDTSEFFDAFYEFWGQAIDEIAKEFAKLHTKYGTTLVETEEIRGYTVFERSNARVRLRPAMQSFDKIACFFTMLKLFNVELNAANLWELIPYSFVVDWFGNTSSLAKWYDYTAYPTMYKLQDLVLSTKRKVGLPVDTYFPGSSGFIFLESYERELHGSFPVIPFDLRFTDPSNHWLEGLSLLVTRL